MNPNGYIFQQIQRGQPQGIIHPTIIHNVNKTTPNSTTAITGVHGNNVVLIQPQYQQQQPLPQQQIPHNVQVVQPQQQVYQQPIVSPTLQQQPQHPLNPFSGYLVKIYEKINSFSTYHLGSDLVLFDKCSVPTPKEFSSIALKIKHNQHIHTQLLPFVLPSEPYQTPREFNKVDVIQYFLDGLSSLLVVKLLSGDKTIYDKQIPLFRVKCKSMIEKLSKYYQYQQQQQQINCNNSIVQQQQQQNQQQQQQQQKILNPIVNHFNRELEMIKNINEYIQTGEINSEASVHLSKTLFSLLTNKGHFWSIEENNENLKLQHYNIIYSDLQRLTISNPKDPSFKYLFGCYCYSFFKIYQALHNIDSSRFISYSSHKSFDSKIYEILKFYLETSNRNLVEAFKDPISSTVIWLIYAKTCCLLNFEDKAHIWIQYFINEAYDRVSAASIIQFDPDIAHYRNESWFIEIMKSIEEEKKNRIIEEEKLINNNNNNNTNTTSNTGNTTTYSGSPSINGNPGVYELYQEFKDNLFLNGMVLKNMNHDTELIGSNILNDLNLHPPLQSKEVELAQKRLDERLELYLLKNSKEIPGDGNCQMHALSDQIYGDISHSQEIRKTIVEWLKKNKDFQLPNGATLNQFVNNNNWDDYCAEMAKLGNWGDHLTLLAAAEIYGMKISIISSVESTSNFFIEIIPTKIKKEQVLLLSHYAEFHYGSLCFINNP